ncbi:unnamed protein product [Durusdinium trenchii]|uniref:2'-phosphotransferase n=2 Tax=Durusdinium trenchii TaxID=1381693 RepID=A0ABP0JCS1_9DINO
MVEVRKVDTCKEGSAAITTAWTPTKKARGRHSRVELHGRKDGCKSWWMERTPGVAEGRGESAKMSLDVEPPPGLCAGMDTPIELLTKVLQEQDVQSKADEDGFISIQWLLKTKPALRCCNTKSLVSAVENQDGPVQLDKTQRRARVLGPEEQLRKEAKRFLQRSPFGAVPLSSFFGMPSFSRAMRESSECTDSEGLLRKVLGGDSDLVVQGAFVSWQPRATKLRKSVERLFLEDARLEAKIQQTADVPLTWIVGRYADRLGVLGYPDNAHTSDALAREVAWALVDSKVLYVDRRRLTVRKCRSPERSPEDTRPGDLDRQEAHAEKRVSSRAATQLRQLLDFYFEPFTLQHNRYLLDLILKRASAPQEKGPWLAEALNDCHFTFEDLQGLGRIQSALSKLPPTTDFCLELGSLKHLNISFDGSFSLRTQLEVRSFVHAENVSKDLAAAAVRYLTASREQQQEQEAPRDVVSVLSYSIADALADQTAGSQRLAKVKRQVLVYQTDLICLQGLDTNEKTGASLAASLTEEGYGFACYKCEEANSIFWDRRRWELIREEEGIAGHTLAVELRPFEDPDSTIRVLCSRAKVPEVNEVKESSRWLKTFGIPHKSVRLYDVNDKVLACTDLSLMGGAEAAGIMDELICLPSVAEEVLGEEVAAHIPAPPGLSEDCELAPVCIAGLNRLRHPDAVFFRNMAPVIVLSGHTDDYLTYMPQEDVVQQFPCFRLPIVAAFHWRDPPEWTGHSNHKDRSVRL